MSLHWMVGKGEVLHINHREREREREREKERERKRERELQLHEIIFKGRAKA